MWEWWRFQEKVLKVSIILQFMFEHGFYWKIKFFQHSLTRVTNRKLCFLQLKLSMFTFHPKIASRKTTPKTPLKWWKNRSLNLKNELPVEAKRWVVKKQFFYKNKKKLDFGTVWRWSLPPPNPVFYKEFARFLHAKKVHFGGPFWLHLGPSCSQNPIIYNEYRWF